MTKDIVERLREASGYALMDNARVTVLEAAAEIERLRGSPVTEPMLKEKRAEGSAVLTDAEREAIEVACQDLRHTEEVATLRGLLERLK